MKDCKIVWYILLVFEIVPLLHHHFHKADILVKHYIVLQILLLRLQKRNAYKKCCENFKSEFMGFEDEQMVQKINKLIFKMQHKDITNMIEDYVNSDDFRKENSHLM